MPASAEGAQAGEEPRNRAIPRKRVMWEICTGLSTRAPRAGEHPLVKRPRSYGLLGVRNDNTSMGVQIRPDSIRFRFESKPYALAARQRSVDGFCSNAIGPTST